MFAFLKIQYQLGKVDNIKLKSFVTKWITAEQYQEITGEAYTA